ncbi:bifunctional DNA primase/polymerase-like protein [Herbihabitans rhizosphaerae]|uniref:Bifunctional DNA primase/polymerase-like protein n=1 Tax=Herbihabitans rhizosphaerae TaxID=1872711 RepID=A0A4Q7KWU3_9PSEU|nr:bifunctional DNA primase/polymerase [Herbihabitans rhizosphaerae]RZS41254.1 bifunctional DNA primase/polymerase-like protein [Herbihabitans rhizosphaerae]
MLETDWSDGWRSAFRCELRAEAVGLASRGWPVMPGTFPTGSEWTGRQGAESDGPRPIHDDWQTSAGSAADHVAEWWSGQPYNLLLATGVVLDAIEVDADLGRGAAAALRAVGVPTPIIATPDGRWLFLVEPGTALRSELADLATLHGTGSWISLPPSPYLHGVVHWRVKPEVCGWRMGDPNLVQDAMIDALTCTAIEAELVA